MPNPDVNIECFSDDYSSIQVSRIHVQQHTYTLAQPCRQKQDRISPTSHWSFRHTTSSFTSILTQYLPDSKNLGTKTLSHIPTSFKHILHTNVSSNAPIKIKGTNFSASDDLALAISWLSITRITTEQTNDMFWKNTNIVFASQLNISQPWTSHSLKNRWTTVQRLTQKYLAAEKLYWQKNKTAGLNVHDNDREIMKLYRGRNASVKGDEKKLAAPF